MHIISSFLCKNNTIIIIVIITHPLNESLDIQKHHEFYSILTEYFACADLKKLVYTYCCVFFAHIICLSGGSDNMHQETTILYRGGGNYEISESKDKVNDFANSLVWHTMFLQ